MFGQNFAGINGACRSKSARGRNKRANGVLIASNYSNQQSTHFFCIRPKSATQSLCFASIHADFNGITTKSNPSNLMRCCRKTSRTARFNVLRCDASGKILLLETIPNLLLFVPLAE